MLITHYGCLSSVLGRQCGYDLVEEQVVFRYLLFRDEMAFSVIFLYVHGFPAVHQFSLHACFNQFHYAFLCAVFLSIVKNMQSKSRLRVISANVSDVLLVSGIRGSTCLPNIYTLACITSEFIDPTSCCCALFRVR